jgi:hypothetical protein
MKNLFHHKVLLQITNVTIKLWLLSLKALFATSLTYTLFQLFTNVEQFKHLF